MSSTRKYILQFECGQYTEEEFGLHFKKNSHWLILRYSFNVRKVLRNRASMAKQNNDVQN